MRTARKKAARGSSIVRQDGLETRQQLLQAAGEVFAEYGHAKATSKEICRRASANVAAVNYHFGSKDGLYAAVLEEAHSRLISMETVATVVESQAAPPEKLRALLSGIVAQITTRSNRAWELRVLSREILSPSPLIERMLKTQVAPKSKLLRGMLAQIMTLPPDHPAVSRSVVSIVGPCLFLLITQRALQEKLAPNLKPDPDALTDHLVCFALGGMQAVAREATRG
jgi:AcrR family transcriptional regulator